jgi:hypothetical protein
VHIILIFCPSYAFLLKAHRYSSFMHAISKIIVYITTSFGLVYLTNISYYGALVIMLPLGGSVSSKCESLSEIRESK